MQHDMKWLAVPLLLAATATQADAGGFSFRFGFGIPHRAKHHKQHRKQCHCHRTWVRGHYDMVRKKVWVPSHYDHVRVKPRYAYRYDACGHRERYMVRRGYKRKIHVRGHWDVRNKRVWHRGEWSYTCNTPGHHH
jgi:hypothetical protein